MKEIAAGTIQRRESAANFTVIVHGLNGWSQQISHQVPIGGALSMGGISDADALGIEGFYLLLPSMSQQIDIKNCGRILHYRVFGGLFLPKDESMDVIGIFLEATDGH